MKKIYVILFSLGFVFLLIFAGCANTDAPEPTPEPETEAPVEQVESNVNGYQIGDRNYAVGDENGDVYFITTRHVGKVDTSGKVTILSDGFQFGWDIALHNNYIYTLRGDGLFRTDKNGDNEYEFPSQFEYGVNTIYICDDILYITTLNEEFYQVYYYADITDDPDTFEFIPGTKDFDRKSFIEEGMLEYPEEHLTEFEKNARVNPVDITEKYAYFITLENKFGRLDRETNQAELLPLDKAARQGTSIINGWIYYMDSSCALYRTSEDMTVTELIYQDTYNSLEEYLD